MARLATPQLGASEVARRSKAEPGRWARCLKQQAKSSSMLSTSKSKQRGAWLAALQPWRGRGLALAGLEGEKEQLATQALSSLHLRATLTQIFAPFNPPKQK